MTHPPIIAVGLLLCFVRITLLYSWTTGFAFFETSTMNYQFSINFIAIQYGHTFIDILMLIGIDKNLKELLYVCVATNILNMVLISQELFFSLYNCYIDTSCGRPFEEISNIMYCGLLMLNSIWLLLVMEAIGHMKKVEVQCEEIKNVKARRCSV